MDNRCSYWIVLGDLRRILDGLMKRADQLDVVIVGTTGLADPVSVAQYLQFKDEFS